MPCPCDAVVAFKYGNGFHRLPRPDLAVVSPNGVKCLGWSGNAGCHYRRELIRPYGPEGLKKAMLAFVCIGFLLCPLQLVEVKIKGFRTMEDPQMDS